MLQKGNIGEQDLVGKILCEKNHHLNATHLEMNLIYL